MNFGYRYRLLCILLLCVGVMMLVMHIMQSDYLSLFSFNPMMVSLAVLILGIVLLMFDTSDTRAQKQLKNDIQQVTEFKIGLVRSNPAISNDEIQNKAIEFIKEKRIKANWI